MVGRQAVSDEARTEDRGKCPAKVPAEGSADSTGASIRHPVALSGDGTASNAEREFSEAIVEAENLVGLGLGVVACFEERRDSDKADLIVPHDCVGLVGLVGQAEGILKHWDKVSTHNLTQVPWYY